MFARSLNAIAILAVTLAAALATSFVGYLVWKIAALPLAIIVFVVVALMVYALCVDVRAFYLEARSYNDGSM
jgi:hypothetical protein